MTKYSRILPLFILLCVVFLAAVSTIVRPSPDEMKSPMIGKKVAFFDIPGMTTPSTKFTPLAWKNKVVVVNFFASWCEPCNAEHAVLMKLAQARVVEIYGIAWKDRPENVGNWLSSKGNPYQMIGIDNTGRTTIAFGLTGVPETFILDRDGTVVYNYRSAITDAILQKEILPLITKLQSNAR